MNGTDFDSSEDREACWAVQIAECFRGDGEIVASAMGPMQTLGARLAQATFEPGLIMTDGLATIVDADGATEGWLPFRSVFDTLWAGRRHVMMGGSQIDRYGNQNFACIGDWMQPKAQLLGVRGAPGNTINHTTSYWIPNHSTKVFVESVDFVSGVGYDRAAKLGAGARFHEIRRVVTDLGTFDFETPDHTMRVRTRHPWVGLDEIVDATGFDLVVPDDVPESRAPTEEELEFIERYREAEGG